MRNTLSKVLLLLMTAVACLMGGAAPATAATGLDVDGINKAVVWVDVSYDAAVEVPFQDGTVETYTTEVVTYCTGWFASDVGHVATAGHCLEFGDDMVVGMFRQIVAENDLSIGTASYEDLTWEYSVSSPTVRIGQPSGIDEGPLSGEASIIAQVLDQEEFLNGDNAVVKIANMSGTPFLSVAAQQPEVGDEVTAIGFAGSVSDVSDVNRQPPSFKSGNVSSLSTSSRGVPYTEIDAPVTQGMSGGPTVNADGEVVGINSFLVRGESQPFNFVTDTQTMRVFLEDNGVVLATAEPEVKPEKKQKQPGNASAEKPVAADADSDGSGNGMLVTLLVVMVVLFLLVLGLLLMLFRRQRVSTDKQPPAAS